MNELLQTFIAAGVAAAVELTILNPLDVIKTRLHLQSIYSPSSDKFGGTVGALREIYVKEGLRGLWRGYFVGLVVVIPRRGFKFASNSMFLLFLDDKLSSRTRAVVSGGLAGACEAVLITPLEVFKVIMQTERIPRGGVTARMHVLLGAVWRHGGVAGLYQGLGATVAKHSLHSCVYFSTYAIAKDYLRVPEQHASSWRNLYYNATAGFLAGMCAGVINNPFDVLKSRMQVAAAADLNGHLLAKDYASQSNEKLLCGKGGIRVCGVMGPMMRLMRTEGVRVLWKGLGAKLLRLGPGSAIIFSVYEVTMSWLQNRPIT